MTISSQFFQAVIFYIWLSVSEIYCVLIIKICLFCLPGDGTKVGWQAEWRWWWSSRKPWAESDWNFKRQLIPPPGRQLWARRGWLKLKSSSLYSQAKKVLKFFQFELSTLKVTETTVNEYRWMELYEQWNFWNWCCIKWKTYALQSGTTPDCCNQKRVF